MDDATLQRVLAFMAQAEGWATDWSVGLTRQEQPPELDPPAVVYVTAAASDAQARQLRDSLVRKGLQPDSRSQASGGYVYVLKTVPGR